MDMVDLIFKVLSGKGSPLEVRQVEDWKNESMKNAREYDALRMFWQNPDEGGDESYNDDLNAIKKSLAGRDKKTKRLKTLQVFLIVAACSILIIYFILRQNQNRSAVDLLVYDHAVITEVIQAIEERHSVKVDLQRELTSCVFSGSLYSKSAHSSLTWLSVNFDWQLIKLSDSHYQLKGEGCGATDKLKPNEEIK